MTNEQKRVKEFMRFFGQICPDKPTQIDFETCKLRANLMIEELLELICKGLGLEVEFNIWDNGNVVINESNLKDINLIYTKLKEVDLEQVADGVGDGIVTGLGTSVACGIDQEPMNISIFDSNDTKAWRQEDLEEARRDHPTAKVEHYGGNLYRLVREDGKIIKSPHYSPADIKSIIEKQQNQSELDKVLENLGIQADVSSPYKPKK